MLIPRFTKEYIYITDRTNIRYELTQSVIIPRKIYAISFTSLSK